MRQAIDNLALALEQSKPHRVLAISDHKAHIVKGIKNTNTIQRNKRTAWVYTLLQSVFAVGKTHGKIRKSNSCYISL